MLQTVREAFSKDAGYWGTREDWYIVTVRTRDADLLEQSNWHYCVEKFNMADNIDKLDVAIERAGHWAVGWIEYLIISPNNMNYVAMAETIERRLHDYPVLDEDAYCNLQWKEAEQYLQDACRDYKARHGRAFPRKLLESAMDSALDHDSYIDRSDLETIVKENRVSRRIPNTIIHNGKRYVCKIYDKPGYLDRYTVVFKAYRDQGKLVYPILASGVDPNGMSYHNELYYPFHKGKHLGKRVSFESLPVAVQNLIRGEL